MPNNDYILRGDAVSAFCENCEGTEVCGQMGEPCDEVKRIMAIPAADVAPRIRCADCRYYEKRCPSEDIGWCNRPGAGCGQPEEFWCAGAERKAEK